MPRFAHIFKTHFAIGRYIKDERYKNENQKRFYFVSFILSQLHNFTISQLGRHKIEGATKVDRKVI